MLAIGYVVGIGFDIAAAAAWWQGKPWTLIVGLLVFGALCHPGAQPTLRQMAKEEATLTEGHGR
jgi:hypothetical protein